MDGSRKESVRNSSVLVKLARNYLRRLAVFSFVSLAFACNNSNFSSGKGDGKRNVPEATPAKACAAPDGDCAPAPEKVTSSTDNATAIDQGGDPQDTDVNVDTASSAFQFGLLVNVPRCAMCHLTVNGDVAATSAVDGWSVDAANVMHDDNTTPNVINGTWYCAESFSDLAFDNNGKPTTSHMPVMATAGIFQNYRGDKLPSKNGQPIFPTLDTNAVKKVVNGSVQGKSLIDGSQVAVSKIYDGNLAIAGDKANPIVIKDEIYVTGDLIIQGYYTGVGSIYVSGNVYIPSDLRAVNSVFPFPADHSAAIAKAKQLVADHKGDALAIASEKSILIADLGTALYDDPRTPPDARRAAAGVDHVYSWFPEGRQGYEKLYKPSVSCADGSSVNGKSFNLIEAYLYSATTIGGISRQGSWAINGGTITNSLHIIGRAGRNTVKHDDPTTCAQPTVSPVHGLPMNSNYINYDYRLAAGLRLLSAMRPFYEH